MSGVAMWWRNPFGTCFVAGVGHTEINMNLDGTSSVLSSYLCLLPSGFNLVYRIVHSEVLMTVL